MKILGFQFGEQKSAAPFEDVLRRLEMVYTTAAGVAVTPDNCEESPTMQAIVNAISMHIATLPVHIFRKSVKDLVEQKEELPNHPVARLLRDPNEWQTGPNYWLDATSCLVRHGKYYAVKGRGKTGPIRRLMPVSPRNVTLLPDEGMARVTMLNGSQREMSRDELHIVRLRANDFVDGDSPVNRCRDSIALEIAAQRFGSNFFGNGAMPGLVFSYLPGTAGHKSKEQREAFVESVQEKFGKSNSFRSMIVPAGMDKPTTVGVENDKAQFLETRKLQRNIIAGAFGVPPHLVGDLERGTFSNIEHQSLEFVQRVILPYVRVFEAAMERDLLTAEDRSSGVCIRFNMDGLLRADFKTRQEGLMIQRQAGVISADDWREQEGMNPLPDGQGGDTYWQQGPSGQNGPPDNEQPA